MRLHPLLLLAAPLLAALQFGCGCRSCGDPNPIVRLDVVIPATLQHLQGVNASRYVSAGASRDFILVWSGTQPAFPPGAFPVWSAKYGTVDRVGHYQAPDALGLDTITVKLPNGWEMEWTLEVIPAPSIQSFTVTPNPAPTGRPVTFEAAYSSRAQATLLKAETILASSTNGTLSATHQPTGSATYTLKVLNWAGDATSQDLKLTVQ